MTRLAELLTFHSDETVTSYCSRLAAACGYRHARSFGADLGFRFLGLSAGNPEDVDTFAAVVGVSRSSLSSGIVTSIGRTNEVSGNSFSRALMQRQRLRFCPYCVRDDERAGMGRKGHRAYGRIEWLIKAFRTCPVHKVMIVTSENEPAPTFVHDFAANLEAEFKNADMVNIAPRPMEPDTLQRYVVDRLHSRTDSSQWLDTMPIHVTIRLCETVGATERNGIRFISGEIDAEEWSACAGTGYDLLCGGEADFRGWLEKQLSGILVKQGDIGGRSVFGRLYERLAHETDDPAFDPVRHIMRDVALSGLPLGPGDDFFGPVTERRLHSVQSASIQFGIHPKRLRKMLVNSGMITGEDGTKTFERILLPSDEMQKFVEGALAGLEVPEAKIKLGTGRVQFETLVKHALIKPLGGDRAASNFISVDRRFDPSDLDKFLERLISCVTTELTPDLVDIANVIRKTNCQFMEVITLLLDHSLKNVAFDTREVGIAGFRLDVEEVRRLTLGEEHGCFAVSELQRLIPASSRIVKDLLKGGWL